jgi:hypothetical protein
MPLTPTFQTMEGVDDSLSGDTITCLVCHRRLQRLDRRLQTMHDMSANAYRERFGIPGRRTLTSAASRIEEFTRLGAGAGKPDLRGRRFKPWVFALVHRLRKKVEVRRTLVLEPIVVSCPEYGAAVSTTDLSGTDPVLCVNCNSPQALRKRQAYLSRIGQASSLSIPIQETNQC